MWPCACFDPPLIFGTAQGEYIKKQFEGQPIEYCIVEDIGAPDAFDEAVKGVEAVAHTVRIGVSRINAAEDAYLLILQTAFAGFTFPLQRLRPRGARSSRRRRHGRHPQVDH